MTEAEPPKRKDKEWRRSQKPEDVKIAANATLERMLAVMNMKKGVELARHIGCHGGDTTKWRKSGVPLSVVHFISHEAKVTMDYLLYGTKPEVKTTVATDEAISGIIIKAFKAGVEMHYLAQTNEKGFDNMAEKITIDIIRYLDKTDQSKD
jgi:hypothetical protein